MKDHIEEKNEHSALTIAICAMVPLYAWASAIKVCLPNDYEMVKSVLEAAKECCKDSYLLGKTLYMHTIGFVLHMPCIAYLVLRTYPAEKPLSQ